jgi:methionine synthase II (cobalamin-independent)
MKKLEPNLLPSHIGSMPHADPAVACDLTFQHFPRLPAWPQLPRRSPLENMYTQFSERFPGIVVEPENNRLYVNRENDLDPELEQLYLAYLEDDTAFGALSPDYAAGLYTFLERAPAQSKEFLAVKGQVTGPVSWGLQVGDQNRRPILYDEILADAVAKFLRLKATWQEKKLEEILATTIIFVDEPYMANFGSALIPIQRDQVITLVEEVLSGIEGLKGTHCCGNTDWSILLETSIDIISFDAYGYGHTLALYPDAVRTFLDRGGIIAWGIAPNNDHILHETADSLLGHLERAWGHLERKGIPREQIISASLITPACGTGTMSVEMAERALELTEQVSRLAQEKYL